MASTVDTHMQTPNMRLNYVNITGSHVLSVEDSGKKIFLSAAPAITLPLPTQRGLEYNMLVDTTLTAAGSITCSAGASLIVGVEQHLSAATDEVAISSKNQQSLSITDTPAGSTINFVSDGTVWRYVAVSNSTATLA